MGAPAHRAADLNHGTRHAIPERDAAGARDRCAARDARTHPQAAGRRADGAGGDVRARGGACRGPAGLVGAAAVGDPLRRAGRAARRRCVVDLDARDPRMAVPAAARRGRAARRACGVGRGPWAHRVGRGLRAGPRVGRRRTRPAGRRGDPPRRRGAAGPGTGGRAARAARGVHRGRRGAAGMRCGVPGRTPRAPPRCGS